MRNEKVTNLTPWMGFIKEINSDPEFASPGISSPYLFEHNLIMAVNRPDQIVLGVWQDNEMAGLFVLIISRDDKNVEMKVDACRSAEALEAVIVYMQETYPGFQADFVFNPANRLLKELLIRKGATFDPEQVWMEFSGHCPDIDTEGVEVLSEPYKEQYLAMHVRDVYWTGEKVLESDRFRVLIGVEDGCVAGYLDVTCRMEENEVYSLLVKPSDRETGWSRKLLVKALEMNTPRGMMVLTNVEDIADTALYESVGFEKVPGRNSITATWIIPEK